MAAIRKLGEVFSNKMKLIVVISAPLLSADKRQLIKNLASDLSETFSIEDMKEQIAFVLSKADPRKKIEKQL